MRCNRKVSEVFEVTAEDIQREKPPIGIGRVCTGCLAAIRSDARLESNYDLQRALTDLGLVLPSVLGILLALFFAASATGASWLRDWRAPFFIGAATSLTGVRFVWYGLVGRYASTHNLAWSFRSRYVVIGLSLVGAGILFSIIVPVIL